MRQIVFVFVLIVLISFGSLMIYGTWNYETPPYSLHPRLENGEVVYDTLWLGISGNEVWAQSDSHHPYYKSFEIPKTVMDTTYPERIYMDAVFFSPCVDTIPPSYLPAKETIAFWNELRDSVRKWMFFWQDSVWNEVENDSLQGITKGKVFEPDWGFGISDQDTLWFFDEHICPCSNIADTTLVKCICPYCSKADAYIDSLLKNIHQSKGWKIVED